MELKEFEKMCRYYFRKGDEHWIITTLLEYHKRLYDSETGKYEYGEE